MGKPDESRDEGGRSILGVASAISLLIIVCIFPPLVLLEDLDDDLAALTFGVSAIFYMLVDPLFLYVPLINEETKCVMLDNRLKIAVIVLRSCGDLRYVQTLYRRIKDGLQSHSLKKLAIAIDTVSILPVPHVVILIFLPNMRGSTSLKIMKFLNSLILLQYLPRLYPIYKMCKQVNRDTVLNNKIVDLDIRIPKWFAIAANISGYILASHSGMQASTNFPEKFLQCFLWGLRNLSSFASNLNTSTYAWENFFVVVIAIIGLILFMYLLGHTQTFMQAVDKSSRILQKMNIIKPKITYMVSEYGLSSYYKQSIEQDVQQILEDDENFIVQNIFSVLQPWLQEDIKRMVLCDRVKLSKVFNFNVNREIMERVEQVSYTGGSYIIREGEPLDMIFFFALGNVVTYSTQYDGSSGSSTTIELKKFEWYGEKDLIPWATQSSSNFSNLPISPITVKSHKQVDIFTIKATDLKTIASKFPGILNTEVHHSTDSTSQMEIAVENS